MLNLIRRLVAPAPAKKGMTTAEFAELLHCGGPESTSGQVVTASRAMRVATVYACVRILAESIAQLPCKIYQCGPDGRHDVLDDGPLFHLLHFPNSWQNGFEFREYLMTCLCLRGNFYALKVKTRGEVVELLPLRPESVSVQRRNWELLYTYTDADGRSGTVGADKMLHVRGLSLDGIMGVSPIRYGRDAIGLAMATEKHGARMFKQGGRPGGVLTHPGKLSDEALEHLKLSWQATHGGENSGGTAILEEGMKYDSVTMTNEDAQYLDTRQFQRTEICALFRVPPHMIGDLTKSSFSNIEQQALEFVKYSVLPWCKRIETALWHGLLSEEQRRQGYRIEFLVDGLERADIKTRYESYSIAIQNGIMSPNECRRLENRNPREGGDVYLQPLNMTDSGGSAGEDESGEVKTLSIESISPPREFNVANGTLTFTLADDESRDNFEKLFDVPQPADSHLTARGFCDVDSREALRRIADMSGCLRDAVEPAENAKAADDDEDEDDEHEHDDWADGEWSEESADLNQIMRDFRPKLEKMYREIVAKEVAEIRKLVDKYFPETEGKRFTKSAQTEFMDALRILYEKLAPDMTADSKRMLYTDLIGPITAMAAKQCGVSKRKLAADLEKTVADYAQYGTERHVERAVGQIRALLREGGDLRDTLHKRLDEWNERRTRKLSKHEAVCASNWYAREAYRRAGVQYLRWVSNGSKTCGFCARLHGKVVGIKRVFADKGETFHSDGQKPLKTPRKIKHPPIHRGCVCAIVPVFRIAGVEQGEPMTHDEANKNRCNPYFSREETISNRPYQTNCQSAVVVYELRRRGYNVEALGRFDNAAMDKVALDQSQAWIVPETGRNPAPLAGSSGCRNLADVWNLLNSVEKDKRYVFNFKYKDENEVIGHIVHAYRDAKGRVCLYDPQTGKGREGKKAVLDFLNKQEIVYLAKDKTGNVSDISPGLLRVDNLEVNVTLVEKILRGATR